jgi:hypothetical protein
VLADIENADNVWMNELYQGANLQLKSLKKLWIAEQVQVGDFDYNRRIQFLVVGLVDKPHSTLAQQSLNSVPAI